MDINKVKSVPEFDFLEGTNTRGIPIRIVRVVVKLRNRIFSTHLRHSPRSILVKDWRCDPIRRSRGKKHSPTSPQFSAQQNLLLHRSNKNPKKVLTLIPVIIDQQSTSEQTFHLKFHRDVAKCTKVETSSFFCA